MSAWRCLVCVSFLLTILLELTYQGPLGLPSSTKLLITSYSVQSTVVSRYAHTLVTSILFNPHAEAHKAIFDLDLPRLAFISNFTVTISNKVYLAEVKEKHQAKKIYEEDNQQGKTAAHVGIQDQESEKYHSSTSLAAGMVVTFPLACELLQRHQGQYQLVVSLRPDQLVTRMSVEITVSERTGIAYVNVPPLTTSHLLTRAHASEADLPPSTRIERGETCAPITFYPSLQDQSAFSSSGIMADFVVQYDVVMEDIIGDVQVYNGFFIHYFASRGLPPVEKNVVFVIDVSGSMFGTKMKQTKKTVNVILSDLWANNYFNIISFYETVSVWKSGGSIQATIQNVHSAKDYLGRMEADGNPHWDGDSEEILGGVGGSMESQANSVGLAKGMLPSIFTFSLGGWGPHFVIHIPHSEEKVGFTLDGRPGELLQLIEDPKAGLHVSGQLLGAPPSSGHEDQICTYFQIITVTADKPQAYVVTITRGSISVLLRRPQLLHMVSVASLTLRLVLHLEFLVLRHYRYPNTLQLPHLGFYVVSGSGLSPLADGLLGQFQPTDIQLVTGPTVSCLRRHHGPYVPVALGKRLLKGSPRPLLCWATCWLVKRSHVERLLGHAYLAYVL
ncbi:LOW QUALITY PROTEIN: inter-alpha-trypsin inhibitor heavy chain H6 [Trichechus inunguis]